jgi:uncharacterized iron-regulated membrane protein
MRQSFVLLHRWFGLFIAVFLFVSGLTGAVISWDHELDEWLNPQFYHASSTGEPQSALALATQVEAADPRIRVTYAPLAVEPGHALNLSVEPRVDPASGQLYDVDYNEIALDPASGKIQGKRMWGAVSLSRENLLPFLYKLHYSMHIPDGWGMEIGVLFMGIVGIVWAIDSGIALWLSFPNLRAWRKSFAFRWRERGYKLNFDLHRSGGVWIWLLLLTLAITSVSMNLGQQVMRPLVSTFSSLTPSPFDTRAPAPLEKPIEPSISRERSVELGIAAGRMRGWQAPAGAVFYSSMYGVYGVGFFAPGQDHGDGGLGNPWLYFDAHSGQAAGAEVPGTGSAGDIFMQAQFPLHSGRIIGVPGRILVSLMGLLVAMLSLTGVLIWAKKRAARVRSSAVRKPRPSQLISDV